jgi:hypothetical protein
MFGIINKLNNKNKNNAGIISWYGAKTLILVWSLKTWRLRCQNEEDAIYGEKDETVKCEKDEIVNAEHSSSSLCCNTNSSKSQSTRTRREEKPKQNTWKSLFHP